jgi:GH35 family endo-1,4-beta-xylanase
MHRVSKIRLALLLAAAVAGPVAAQTSLTGSSLALQSGSPTLSTTGYVGTYLNVPAGGATVKFTINASASSGASTAPHMNLAIADTLVGFPVATTSATNYTTQNITLPAGTYAIRNERDYAGNIGVTRSFTVNNLSVSTVSGTAATFSNTLTDSNALSAANTYISNFRQGAATLSVRGPGNIPLLAGAPVTVDLARHAFNFGGTVSGVSASDPKSMVNVANPAPGTEAYKFQQFINTHFNMIVPSNAGKWASNESTRDSVQMGYVDTILNYAQSHNMRARMHNHLWGNQQPSWATTLLSSAAGGDATAKTDLRAEITERTQYYVNAARANKLSEIDVYNESYHTGSNNSNPANYWNVYGQSGIADIYNELQQAVSSAGSSAKIYTNEYNVFQWGDAYANWYKDHIESIRHVGGTVSGVGFQYYADPTLTGSNAHSPTRMGKALMGLSAQGLPMSLTEFGLSSALTTAQADAMGPGVMDDAMRMMFGTPQATSFLIWGWWDLATNPTRAPAALLDNTNGNNTLTPMGVRWEQLMSEWDTTVTANLDSQGAMTFKGFYGDYTVGGQPFALTLAKGTSQYATTLVAPPTWSIWNASNSGNWSSAANWTNGGSANVAGQTAYFPSAASGRNVTVDGDKTVGMLAFNSSASYTLSGSGTITLQGFNNASGHVAAVYVTVGNHTISAPLLMADNTTVTINPASSTLTASNLLSSNAILTKRGAGTFLVNNVRASSLVINTGSLQVQSNGTSSGVSVMNTLSIAPGAVLDLADNDLVVNSSSFTSIKAMATQGLITSSSATESQMLALFDNALVGLSEWEGLTISGSAIVGKYTFFGDANIDGQVTGDDYTVVDANLNTDPPVGLECLRGDMNLDGVVTGDDYTTIDARLGLGVGTL